MSRNVVGELRKAYEAGTKGPWRWKRMGTPAPILIGDHGMRPIILAASRKGMQGACITMRNAKLDIMLEASEDHPDAVLIEAMHCHLPALLAVAEAARGLQEHARLIDDYVDNGPTDHERLMKLQEMHALKAHDLERALSALTTDEGKCCE